MGLPPSLAVQETLDETRARKLASSQNSKGTCALGRRAGECLMRWGKTERGRDVPRSRFWILSSDFWILLVDMPEVGIEPTRALRLSGF